MIDDLYDILVPLRTFVYGDGVRTDNLIFRIMTKHTSFVFCVCFVVHAICLYFSTPISCISDSEVANVIDTFCWIKAMYTLPSKPEKDLVIHEGVRQQEPSDQLLVHHFYQFVYIILFLQGMLLYFPSIIWHGMDNGRMKSYKDLFDKISPLKAGLDEEVEEEEVKTKTPCKDLLDELVKDTVDSSRTANEHLLELVTVDDRKSSYKQLLNQINPLMAEMYAEKMEKGGTDPNKILNENKGQRGGQKRRGNKEKRKRTKRDILKAEIAKYLNEEFHHYNFYAGRFVICEILAVVNIIINIFIMNVYLGSTFLTYGVDLLLKYSYDEESLIRSYPATSYFSRTNQITSRIFPKVTKCTMKVTGPGGNIVPYDALCVLSINIANEVIYFFLWWWLAYILCVCALGIIYRLIVMCNAYLRVKLIKRCMHSDKMNEMSGDTRQHFDMLMKDMKYSTWFVLSLIKKNTDRITFTEVIIEMANQDDEYCKKQNSQFKNHNTDEVDASCSRTIGGHHSKPRGTLNRRAT